MPVLEKFSSRAQEIRFWLSKISPNHFKGTEFVEFREQIAKAKIENKIELQKEYQERQERLKHKKKYACNCVY